MTDALAERDIAPQHPDYALPRLPQQNQSTTIQRTQDDYDRTVETLRLVRDFIAHHLVEGEDYGKLFEDRKSEKEQRRIMYHSGAQKLALFFDVRPEYMVAPVDLHAAGAPFGHVEYVVTTLMLNQATDAQKGQGVGSCSTMESKYRYRFGERTCPACGKASIIKGKAEYGGGWVCFQKKGGCNAKYKDDDAAIKGQEVGKVDNPDIWDQRNTVLKMAKKRSFVDAAISLAGVGDMFTQDLEEVAAGDDDARPTHGEARQRAAQQQTGRDDRHEPEARQRPSEAAQEPRAQHMGNGEELDTRHNPGPISPDVAADPKPKTSLFKMLDVEFRGGKDDIYAFLRRATEALLHKQVEKVNDLSPDEARIVLTAIKTGRFKLPSER